MPTRRRSGSTQNSDCGLSSAITPDHQTTRTAAAIGPLFLVACFLTTVVLCGASAQELPLATVDTQRAYTKTALVHQWNVTRDNVMPSALLKASLMAREGRPKGEIISTITKMREDYHAAIRTGHRRDWQLDEDYKATVRHLGGIAGAVIGKYSPIPGLNEATALVTDLGLMTYEHLVRDKRVIQASEKVGQMYYNVQGAEDNVAELVIDTWHNYPTFRDIYIEQFQPQLLVTPDDNVDTINRKLPLFETQINVTTVRKLVSKNRRLTKEEILQIAISVTGITTELRRSRQEAQEVVEKQAAEEKQRQIEHVKQEGLRSAAFLATTALQMVDPELGRQAQAISSAAFQVNDAIKTFKAASRLGEDLTGAAAMTLTGNFVGVAFTLIGAFQDAGPSPDEIILQEIAKVREDIEAVRTQMHERFGIVERQLELVYVRLDEGLVALEKELRSHRRRLDRIARDINNLQNQVRASTGLVLRRLDNIEELIRDMATGHCKNWKPKFRSPLLEGEYEKCILKMQEQFARVALKRGQLLRREVTEAQALTAWLRERPNDLASLSFNSLRALTSGAHLATMVPAPEKWQDIATIYLDFVGMWPERLHLLKDGGLSLEELRRGGEEVEALVQSARHQLTNFTLGEKGNAIARLLDSVRSRSGILEQDISQLEREYAEEGLLEPKLDELGPVSAIPIRDRDRCVFHAGGSRWLEGEGYIAMLPEPLDDFIPTFVRHLLHAGIGHLEYCLELTFERTTELSYGKCRTRGELWCDAEVLYRPGPYTIVLRLDYVLDGLECDVPLKRSGIMQLARLSASDNKRKGGRQEFFQTIEGIIERFPARSVVAPQGIWDEQWRKKFVTVAKAVVNESGVECLEKQLSAPLKVRWAETAREPMSKWIREKLVEKESILEADRDNEYDYALLSHWIWSGYADAAKDHDTLAHLIVGTARGPTIAFVLKRSNRENRELVWSASSAYLEYVNEFANVLRSEEVLRIYSSSTDNFGIKMLLHRIDELMANSGN